MLRFYFLLQFFQILICLFATTKYDDVPRNLRIDCAPRFTQDANQKTCQMFGCMWDNFFDQNNPTVPLCYYPRGNRYTSKTLDDNTKIFQFNNMNLTNFYGKSFPNLIVKHKNIRHSTLKVSITTSYKRYIPPVSLNEKIKNFQSSDTSETLTLKHDSENTEFFQVQRFDLNNSNINIWDTSIGGLVFTDKFIQIATYLPTDRIFGFGEHIHSSLKHNFQSYKTWVMYAVDDSTDSININFKNGYGVHPFYMGLDFLNKAYGVFIFNSNAQEIVTGPGPHLIYRTIGGQLDIYFFAGPKPEDVIRQYLELIGRPFLPPYWAFGYQFSRYGFSSVDDIKATINRIQNNKIPLDVVYLDIDYMDQNKDFTINSAKEWSNLIQYVEELHKKNLKLMLIFDPAIQVDSQSFERAIQLNASFISWPNADLVQNSINDLYALTKNKTFMLGVVWPNKHVAFPDFLDSTNATQKWWLNEFQLFHKIIPFDGVWIDMNEPSNFETNKDIPHYPKGHAQISALHCPLTGHYSQFDNPPYQTYMAYNNFKRKLSYNTLCMLGVSDHGKYKHYDVHNLYGWSEIKATSKALKNVFKERTSLFSRSTFPSSGVYGGHWLGDNSANWEDLRTSIIGIQEFNLFGIPFVGADVCGFIKATTEELCLRWHQLGAFYPFYRNHNSDDNPPQDPAQWKSVTVATRAANIFRYQNMPYLYSLHFRVALSGGTVVRPIFFEFPNDFIAQKISYQFMWGPSLLIMPVIYPNVNFVHGYLPINEVWYSLSYANHYGKKFTSGYSDFNAPRNQSLPVFIRGGSIIIQQKSGYTLSETYKNNFRLIAALTNNFYQFSIGELFWDDGKSSYENIQDHNYLHFKFHLYVDNKFKKSKLFINCTNGYNTTKKMKLPYIEFIKIFGFKYKPNFSSFKINDELLKIDMEKSYYNSQNVLKIKTLIDINNFGPNWEITF